jgi:hypothetical protein
MKFCIVSESYVLLINEYSYLYEIKSSGVRFPMRSLDFAIDLNLSAALCPWSQLKVLAACNRNEYQESSWG